MVLIQSDRLDEAKVAPRAGMTAATDFGSSVATGLGHLVSARAHFVTGRFADVDVELETAGLRAEEAGLAWAARLVPVRAYIALLQGTAAETVPALAQLASPVAEDGYGRGPMACALMILLVATGQVGKAAAAGWRAWKALGEVGMARDPVRVSGPISRRLGVCSQ